MFGHLGPNPSDRHPFPDTQAINLSCPTLESNESNKACQGINLHVQVWFLCVEVISYLTSQCTRVGCAIRHGRVLECPLSKGPGVGKGPEKSKNKNDRVYRCTRGVIVLTVLMPPSCALHCSVSDIVQSKQASRQGKARQGKARQGKARQGKARQGKARPSEARPNEARQSKEKKGKAKPSKAIK